ESRGKPQGGPPEPRGEPPEPRGAVHEHRNFSAADRQLRGRRSGWQHEEERARIAQQDETSSIAGAEQEDNSRSVTLEQNREWPQNRRPISMRLPLHTQQPKQPQQMHSMLPPVRHSGTEMAHIRIHELPEGSGEAAVESLLSAPEQPKTRRALQTIVSEEGWTLGFRPLRVSFIEGQDFLSWSRALELLQDANHNGPGTRLRQALTAVLRDRPPFEVFSLDFSAVSYHGKEKFELVIQKGSWGPGPTNYSDFLQFAYYLNSFTGQQPVMTFECPGSGRIFIAPAEGYGESGEHDGDDHFGSLASFLRSDAVPKSQKDELWLELGRQVSLALLTSNEGTRVWVSNERGNDDWRLSIWAALIVSRDCRCVVWKPYREYGELETQLQLPIKPITPSTLAGTCSVTSVWDEMSEMSKMRGASQSVGTSMSGASQSLGTSMSRASQSTLW
ncbi:unnamed protein product, partial [Polarella glacialis]